MLKTAGAGRFGAEEDRMGTNEETHGPKEMFERALPIVIGWAVQLAAAGIPVKMRLGGVLEMEIRRS
jgi:hypothetical protein